MVRVGYPVRAARTYLNRHLGNPVGYRLVEAERGKRWVRYVKSQWSQKAQRNGSYPRGSNPSDGTPATYFAPGDLVETRAKVETETGGPIPPIRRMTESCCIFLFVVICVFTRLVPRWCSHATEGYGTGHGALCASMSGARSGSDDDCSGPSC